MQPIRAPSTAALSLLALGIVYGDIGTSPLYAVKETFAPGHGIPLDAAAILGGLSTIFWILMVIVSLKYVTLVLRADNKGEGGIMALLALASAAVRDQARWRGPVMLVGVIGASLFFGEAVLTPAISVLSAVEGLQLGAKGKELQVVPIAAGVLVALFLIQRNGTGAVGKLFGPICGAWFLALSASGLWNIGQNPQVLAALDPSHALHFVTGYGVASYVVLGSVLLAITGAEALYADMGHFGKRAVRIAWFGLVAPALVLNYFGQGALLLRDPAAIANPFYLAFPGWALYPMVALATAATVIASQATISGAFSVTQQAVQLGFVPRMAILHTSERTAGQIYVPAINWLLLAAVLAVVVGFGSSAELAQAYGVAVMGTMLSTTFLTFFVVRYAWKLPLALCFAATGFFFLIEATLLSAALTKILEGGWLPLAIGAVVCALMLTWRRGRALMAARLRQTSVPLTPLIASLLRDAPARVPGTAVFLAAAADAAPHALLHNLNHNRILHERVVFLTVEIRDVPWVTFSERVKVKRIGNGCWMVRLRFGFMNRPDVMRALDLCGEYGLTFDLMETSFFLSRQQIVPSPGGPSTMWRWRERMFATMARNAGNVTDYFNVPTNRVIELGTRIEI